jgi:hypothetical protein
MSGATNFRMFGPTAVVTISAAASSSMTASGALALLSARKNVTSWSSAPAPTSWTT